MRKIFALAFAVATAALAADAPPADPAPQPEALPAVGEPEYVEVNLEYVPASNSIAAKLPLALEHTPANVGVIGGTLLREQDAFDLSDAVRNVSGMQSQPNAGVHDFFLIRGFDSLSGSLVLTDGASEPEATHYALYNVEGIEVLKGPAGFLYGNDPLAGVVNLVRKQPLPADFARVTGSLASFATAEATIDWNTASTGGGRSFRLNGLYQESDHYREDKSSRQIAVNPGLALRLGAEATLNLSFEYLDAEYSPDAGIPLVAGALPDVPRRRSYQTPFDYSDQQIARFQVDYEQRLSERLTLRNKLYFRGLDWDTRGTQFAGVFPDFTSGRLEVSRYETTLDDRQRFSGNQLEAVWALGTGKVRHSLLAGFEARYLTDTFDIGFVPPENPLTPGVPGVPSLDLYAPVETAVPLEPFPFLAGESRAVVLAPYVVDQIELSERVRVLAGARYDAVSRDDERAGTSPPVAEDLSRHDGELSPMAGVVWSPATGWSVYANAAESFAPAGVRVVGELEPEQSRGYEVGLKKKLHGDAVRATLALYQIDRENVAIPDDNGVTQQAGDQRSRGVELELAAELASRLRFFVAYAYTDAELVRFTERVVVGFDPDTGQPIEATVDRSGNTPAFVPEHLLSVWISKSLGRRFDVGGGARWFSDQFVAEDNGAAIDGALVLDAMLAYSFEPCRLTLNLKNLSGTDYEQRGFGATSVIPADAFSVSAGFDWRF